MEIDLTKSQTVERCGQCVFRVRGVCTLSNVFVSEYMRSCSAYNKYASLESAMRSIRVRLDNLAILLYQWSITHADYSSCKEQEDPTVQSDKR
jgi:hypothetical protein